MSLAFGSPRSGSSKDALLAVATLTHVVVTLAFALGLRFVGEANVVTAVALYLPRWPLGVPFPLLLLALAWRRRRWLAGLEALAGLCWVFALLGLQLGLSRSPTPGRRALRVVSFNVHEDVRAAPLLDALRAANADLIALQECGDEDAAYWQHELPGYEWVVRSQFVLGSRFPVVEVSRPVDRGVAYVKYRVQLPEGPVLVYSAHPPSPRLAMRRVVAGSVPHDPARLARVAAGISANANDRATQLQTLTADARASALPVIIAADTNLPDPSPVLAHTFAGFADAFSEVGRGFGYTFPAGRWLGPWMRIDRVFVNHALRVLDCTTLPPAGSDHLAVLAVVER